MAEERRFSAAAGGYTSPLRRSRSRSVRWSATCTSRSSTHSTRSRADACGARPGGAGAGDTGRGRPRPRGRAIRRASGREQVTLRVCTMAERVLDGPLRAVGAAIPGVEVFVTSSPGDDAVEAVRQARADAAVVWSRPQEHRDLDGIVLGSVPFGVVLPQAHPLADQAEIPVAGLGQDRGDVPAVPLLRHWQRIVDHLCRGSAARAGRRRAGPHQQPRGDGAGRRGGVRRRPGDPGVAEHMDVSGIVVRPLDPPLFLDLEVVWRRPARPAVRRLVDFLVRRPTSPRFSYRPIPSSPRRPGPSPRTRKQPACLGTPILNWTFLPADECVAGRVCSTSSEARMARRATSLSRTRVGRIATASE